MTIDDLQDATSVTMITIGYRACCTAPECGNVARTILRYADAGGRPLVNLERCHRHVREGIESRRCLHIFFSRRRSGRRRRLVSLSSGGNQQTIGTNHDKFRSINGDNCRVGEDRRRPK